MVKDWHGVEECRVDLEPPYPGVFDLIIIGGGPAGLTAAIYAARRKLKTLLVCKRFGGQMNYCNDIENWTGVAQSTGPGLRDQFLAHVKKIDDDNAHYELWLKEGVLVERVSRADSGFTLKLESGEELQAKSLILAMGKTPRLLGVPGEKIGMAGNGVSFAATSDAPLYAGKKMIVIGGANAALDVALQLSKYTSDVTIITNEDQMWGEDCLRHRVEADPHIQVRCQLETEEILLDERKKVCGIVVRKLDGDRETVSCQGVFEEVGQLPATDFLANLVALNGAGEVITNRQLQTTVPGVFAAGDCNDGIRKQVIVAAGEGAMAALEAYDYLLNEPLKMS